MPMHELCSQMLQPSHWIICLPPSSVVAPQGHCTTSPSNTSSAFSPPSASVSVALSDCSGVADAAVCFFLRPLLALLVAFFGRGGVGSSIFLVCFPFVARPLRRGSCSSIAWEMWKLANHEHGVRQKVSKKTGTRIASHHNEHCWGDYTTWYVLRKHKVVSKKLVRLCVESFIIVRKIILCLPAIAMGWR